MNNYSGTLQELDNQIKELTKTLRYYILTSTTQAGAGHPTTSLSPVELMATLFCGGFFRYDLTNKDNSNNDRLIFSKGHASPLFYALWAAAGGLEYKELSTYRMLGSRLEGHPTPEFPFTEAATGSLGQGLSIGVGMALNGKHLDGKRFDGIDYNTYVLLGDGELMEGSVWEAAAIASYYKLDNLVAIVDVNRLEQTGPTIHEWDLAAYERKFKAFGWATIVVEDGHDIDQCYDAFNMVSAWKSKPVAIIAKTIKGKGVSLWEDKEKWHSKTLSQEQLEEALTELGEVNLELKIELPEPKPINTIALSENQNTEITAYSEPTPTKLAYGNALTRLGLKYSEAVVLDTGTENSTTSELFEERYPDRFFKMYIAEQNSVGVALGLALRKKIPFLSMFAAFFTRAHDQLRMSQYSNSNVKFCGSYAGVSIGKDGSSQMGLEDIALFRTLQNCVVFYPSDAIATEKLVELAALHEGNVYIRATREPTPIIYSPDEEFTLGGHKVLKSSQEDVVAVIGGGITLHEALKAYSTLVEKGIQIRVIDLYSIKPVDRDSLITSLDGIKKLLVVEDHVSEGGMCEAVRSTLFDQDITIYSMAVNKIPHSGTPQEVLAYVGIDAASIVTKVQELTLRV